MLASSNSFTITKNYDFVRLNMPTYRKRHHKVHKAYKAIGSVNIWGKIKKTLNVLILI